MREQGVSVLWIGPTLFTNQKADSEARVSVVFSVVGETLGRAVLKKSCIPGRDSLWFKQVECFKFILHIPTLILLMERKRASRSRGFYLSCRLHFT